MKTPNERLRAIRVQRGFESARDAARAYGWPVNAYASHENGHRGIPPDAAIKYSQAYGFTLDWLYKGADPIKTSGVLAKPDVAFRLIPRLSWEFMKTHGGIEKAMEKATEYTSLPQTLNIKMPAFSMVVSGDSMRNSAGVGPSFDPGELIIFSTRELVSPGDFILAELLDENTVIFRQYRERGLNADGFMTYELAPLNSAFPTRLITKEGQARIVARMQHSIKSY
jgi:hypothetical protein